MTAERMFNVAGFSTLSGKRKVRFANGTVEARTKVLERNGHTDVDLRKLPKPMSKAEAMKYLGIEDHDEAAPKGVQAKAAKTKAAAKPTHKPAHKTEHKTVAAKVTNRDESTDDEEVEA